MRFREGTRQFPRSTAREKRYHHHADNAMKTVVVPMECVEQTTRVIPCSRSTRLTRRRYVFLKQPLDTFVVGLLMIILIAISTSNCPGFPPRHFCLAFRPTFPTRQTNNNIGSLSFSFASDESPHQRPKSATSTSSHYGTTRKTAPCSCCRLSALSASTSRLPATASSSWYPRTSALYDDDIFAQDDATAELEDRAVQLTARLIRHRLRQLRQDDTTISDNGVASKSNEKEGEGSKENVPATASKDQYDKLKQQTVPLVRGRFRDLTCTREGEDALEHLFWQDDAQLLGSLWQDAAEAAAATGFSQHDVVRAAVMVVQSLCVMGTQVGVKGAPQQLLRLKAHLEPGNNNSNYRDSDDLEDWNSESIRRLKYNVDRAPALALLSELKWKKTPQRVFDLLWQMGAWEKHEDLALLRSGFPIRFTDEEEKAADDALERVANDSVDTDPDTLLELRRDFRHHKVYTIDAISTSEIDDGLSVEAIERVNENGETSARHRLWIHIADADRWAPRDSELFDAARRRITSLYLPRDSISMFPPKVATETMSLNVNQDVCALSLGVELNDDGSIDKSSLVVTPSLIRVTYRLSYEEVDEMLEEGIAYNEEWQLGALLAAAIKRRAYRVRNGSQEGLVPNPVPFCSVSVFSDNNAPDGVGISVNVQVSHNAARNKTATAEDGNGSSHTPEVMNEPVSSAYLLVTEAMILAGEAISCWKISMDAEEESRRKDGGVKFENYLRLPFRSQPQPDFKSRSRERKVMMELLEYNVGHGFCHAWYARRFLNSVTVTETVQPHSGLGLGNYVQWSSPIRRFSDLQVHEAVKRYLRRRKVYELQENGQCIPDGITALDLGLPENTFGSDGSLSTDSITTDILDEDIDYMEGVGLIGAARTLQRQSQQYWLFEHIRREKEKDRSKIYNAVVLGCIDPEKHQYAIYVKELGLEHRYSAPGGGVKIGDGIQLKVDNVAPRGGILSFVRIV